MTPTQVSDEEANLFALKLASASVLPMVLKVAIELDLLEIIAKAGLDSFLSLTDIASQLPTKNPDLNVLSGLTCSLRTRVATNPNAPTMLDRMLCLLASYSILNHSFRTLQDGKVERLYGLGPIYKFLTKNEDGVSLAPLCVMSQDKVLMESWYHLKDADLDGGIPFNKAYGMTTFEYQQDFQQGNTYKGFKDLKSIVDVGSGTGAVLSMIVSKYPSIKGINFDLPHVIEDGPQLSSVEHVGGDMFVSVPKGDAIFMKWICHDWNDEHCLKILKNCYETLPVDGKVIVAECILPVAPGSSLSTRCTVNNDVNMLVYNSGGKERTEKEFEALAEGAGFQGFRVVCEAFNIHVIEFLKKP
ncbi:hypothetical protein UlMin_043978 [Ulmus minor]